MITLNHTAGVLAPALSIAAMLCGGTAFAQSATPTCRPAQVIPLTGAEPAATLVINAPLADPLARGVVVIPYCAENMRIAPVFGPGALAVSPRVGHIHVTVTRRRGTGRTRVATRSSFGGCRTARTKCASNWLTRTTSQSTRAPSHLMFQRRPRQARLRAEKWKKRPH